MEKDLSPTCLPDPSKGSQANLPDPRPDATEEDPVPQSPKISIHDKLFNMTAIVIPHLESVVVDLGKVQTKFNVINKHIIDQLATLKKKLGYLQAITDPNPEVLVKLVKKKPLQKIAEALGLSTAEIIPDGLNLVELDRLLDYIESKLFLPAFKKWKSMPSRTRLAKKMMVFCRKVELIIEMVGRALHTSKDDIFSQDPIGEVWKKINQYTNYIVAFYNPASVQ